MAGIAYVKKRLYNPELIVDPDGVLPMKLRQTNIKGANPIYYINWYGTTEAGEELGTAKTATKDGTTTPYLVNVVSSSALDDYDDTATSGCRAVAIIGPSVSSVAAYTAGEVPLATVEVLWSSRRRINQILYLVRSRVLCFMGRSRGRRRRQYRFRSTISNSSNTYISGSKRR